MSEEELAKLSKLPVRLMDSMVVNLSTTIVAWESFLESCLELYVRFLKLVDSLIEAQIKAIEEVRPSLNTEVRREKVKVE
ncbi:MAG: hypothetical protein DRJ98_05820 [Thermoprotei archaeon]|nr:MAG: hypothetical protein DRJ98_05820 [Thermoprotei archaeon]RLF18060.1 MAG: hypothetical protein DRN06_02490 [Thermoprotei archaeon]